jgi:hypothetical protein
MLLFITLVTVTNTMGRPKKENALSNAERQRRFKETQRTGIFPPPALGAIPPPRAVKTRKPRSDSVTAAVKAIAAVTKKQHMPPAHKRLPEGWEHYWFGIMDTRALDDWTHPELCLAADLCKLNCIIENHEALLEEAEDAITPNNFGNMIINPRAAYVEKLHARKIVLMRSLRMGGVAAGRKEELVAGRVLEGNARKMMQDEDDPHGLLA